MADDILKEAKEAFQDAQDAEHEDRTAALDDLKFARLGEQWPSAVWSQRQREGRPCLTINKMPAFIRQVVNDARQNKPSIKVHPVDSGADKETADVLNGLIRNIEYVSGADVAYDTATEYAVGIGFGYFGIDLNYTHEDTFDLDITIERKSNPFSIYRDPASTAADSSDWNTAFEVEMIPKKEFRARFPKAKATDWASDAFDAKDWATEDSVMVAGWWRREGYEKPIVLLSDGTIHSVEQFTKKDEQGLSLQDVMMQMGVQVVNERTAKCRRVYRCLLTAAEELEKTTFPGQYIPIIPVYGDEVDVEGKRYFRSLIRDAKDAQRMFNYWRTTTTELIALAPKTPFIGKTGAFNTDAAKWATANTASHSHIEYDGQEMPQRQPFVGVPAGALQEALNASDDMKAIMGLYDASLGARSNETSGRAIMARQREGDVSTFHFQDNMSRAIRHAGRVILGLIPHVYNKARMIRTIGEDGSPQSVQIGPASGQQPRANPQQQMQQEQSPDIPVSRIYDLAVGKYDVTVTTGPSFTTRREEAAVQMTEFVRAFPAAAPVIGDLIASNLDWPGADEIAERLKAVNPVLQGQNIPPEVQQQIAEGQQMLQQQGQEIQKLTQENQSLKMDKEVHMAELAVKDKELAIKDRELDIKAAELQMRATDQQIDGYRAETEREVAQKPPPPEQPRKAAIEVKHANAP